MKWKDISLVLSIGIVIGGAAVWLIMSLGGYLTTIKVGPLQFNVPTPTAFALKASPPPTYAQSSGEMIIPTLTPVPTRRMATAVSNNGSSSERDRSLLREDFSNGIPSTWRIISGDIVVVNGKLSAVGNGEGVVEIPLSLPASFRIQAHLSQKESPLDRGRVDFIFGSGFLVGIGEPGWMSRIFSTSPWWVIWYKREGGEWKEITSVSLDEQEWSTLEIEVNQDRKFGIYKDGDLVSEVFYPLATPQFLRMKVYDGMAIEDITIYGLP